MTRKGANQSNRVWLDEESKGEGEKQREGQRGKSANQNEGQFGMFPARSASQVTPGGDNERDYRSHKKGRVEETSMSVDRNRGGGPGRIRNCRLFQKETGLAKDDYSDRPAQP